MIKKKKRSKERQEEVREERMALVEKPLPEE